MKKFFILLASIFIFLTTLTIADEGAFMTDNPENTIQIELKDGNVIIELLPEIAPNHVSQIKELAREGFYDGVPFHRVIPGFMAQTGDGQNRNGTGGSSKPDLIAEFNSTPHLRGTVSMARSSDPNSANSQFFICFGETPHLNGQYTVFGQVIEVWRLLIKLKEVMKIIMDLFQTQTRLLVLDNTRKYK